MTDKTDRTARRHFNLLMFNLLTVAATAATSPLASTNDYYYTTPKTTNIFGRVMGEHGDYRLVRAEDVAFVNEAWAERIALADGLMETNAVPGGPLVRGGFDGGSSSRYWERAALRTCVLTNHSVHPLTEASGGKMTNITCSVTNAASGKLVTTGALTNMFATLKKMDCLVIEPALSSSNEIVRIETGHSEYKVNWWDEPSVTDYDPITNRYVLTSWSFSESGWGSKENSRITDESWEEDKAYGMTRSDGAGTVRMAFKVGNTNAWLRGQGSPKVVREARVWAVVGAFAVSQDLSYGKYPYRVIRDEYASTNAVVLLDLGEARWSGVETDSLVYETDIDIREMYGALATEAGWMPSLSSVEAEASYPSIEATWGYRSKSKSMNLEGVSIYLVLWLKPVASLDGW